MLSSMFEAMAQEYNERQKEPPIMPATIQTITRAYTEICQGEDPWTALGNFSNAWYSYAKHIRTDLVREPLVKPEQETEHTHRWAAFCASSVEFLCERYNVSCPDWAYDSYYTLEAPWWYSLRADDPSIQEHLLKTTPAPFARRNIFCSNRLFQNKYEMFELMLEARAKGITDMSKIREYARRKELSIHGG